MIYTTVVNGLTYYHRDYVDHRVRIGFIEGFIAGACSIIIVGSLVWSYVSA